MAIMKMKVTMSSIKSSLFICILSRFKYLLKIEKKVSVVLTMLTAAASDPTVRKDYRFSVFFLPIKFQDWIFSSHSQDCVFISYFRIVFSSLNSRIVYSSLLFRIRFQSISTLIFRIGLTNAYEDGIVGVHLKNKKQQDRTMKQFMAGDIGPGEMGCGIELMVPKNYTFRRKYNSFPFSNCNVPQKFQFSNPFSRVHGFRNLIPTFRT